MNRKGFTIVELIMSVLFIGIIFTTVTAMWSVSSGIFTGTTADTVAHKEAVACESMLRSVALNTKELIIKAVDENSPEEALETSLRDYLDMGKDYIAFGFHEGCYKAALLVEANDGGEESFMFISYETLKDYDDLQIGFVNVGTKVKMKYSIGKKQDDSGYWVEGGIILEALDSINQDLSNIMPRELGPLYDPVNKEALLFEKDTDNE